MTKTEMTEEKAFEQDVRTMSYEELMETIRYLDTERRVIVDRVQGPHKNENHWKEQDVKKAA